MGQAELNTTQESLDPIVQDMILDILSYGIARSIVNSAVKSLSPNEVTQEVSENLAD